MPRFPARLRKGPLPLRYVFLLTFVFFMFATAVSLWIVNKAIEPVLMEIAEKETKRIANLVINNAIEQQFLKENTEMSDLITVQKDESGKIASVDFNTAVVNRILAKTDDYVMQSLKAATEGKIAELEFPDDKSEKEKNNGIIYYIPIGQVTDNALLGNLGPRVPVQFQLIGNVTSDVTKEIKPFGINNALIEVDIHVSVDIQVVIPFATKAATVSTDIPIAMQVIQGEVPEFYNDGGNVNPSFKVPSQ
ncbi:sporulation protein YunB [Parageobacillus thermoglucosidasius]|uniref:Sporulation protein YunB n=1 Tax=Geobacillus sp. (strain Y4.1MC1) TaxID=581103 RepID=A0A7U4DJT8_GEOS0|nr:sporulation protein YunB [Parageobacillus thermoglucosidasius]MED4905273.1 sporulation protein YunB [Parageobacillus thermoglucosidasius]MED4914236.1 sporulation protein YunB [Parageobacillus thermoglucosidasius]MED4945608.1 sporulation protein YunB [Parageobacillus thermoglucosidasius]MED4981447.1 sporulation protein YunB [Parageobacillus thermoglucosidasius]RDE29485.1 sporulation protein YunB [Parageobacillus thermoglucosidasius]